MLLAGGVRSAVALDVGGDGHRLDLGEREAASLAPPEELTDGLGVGGPGIGVPDVDGEKFQEAAGGMIADVGDDGRDDHPSGSLDRDD